MFKAKSYIRTCGWCFFLFAAYFWAVVAGGSSRGPVGEASSSEDILSVYCCGDDSRKKQCSSRPGDSDGRHGLSDDHDESMR